MEFHTAKSLLVVAYCHHLQQKWRGSVRDSASDIVIADVLKDHAELCRKTVPFIDYRTIYGEKMDPVHWMKTDNFYDYCDKKLRMWNFNGLL